MDILSPEFWSFLWDGARYEALIETLGPWAPLIAIAAMLIVSFLPLPAETVAVANGMAFGQAYGFFLTWIGAMIAAALAFWLARWLGQPLIIRFVSEGTLARFEDKVKRRGVPFLLFVRMIPLVPFTVVNYGSGLSPISFRTYLWTSAIGMSAPIFAFVSAGALMKEQPWMGWVSIAAAILLFSLAAYWLRGMFREEPVS